MNQLKSPRRRQPYFAIFSSSSEKSVGGPLSGPPTLFSEPGFLSEFDGGPRGGNQHQNPRLIEIDRIRVKSNTNDGISP